MTSEKISGTTVLHRLGSFVAEDRAMLWLVVAFAILLGVLGLATPIAVQALVNFVAFGGLMQPLIVIGLLLLFFLSLSGAIRLLKSYVVELLQRRLFIRIARGLSSRLPRVKLESHDKAYTPELVNRFFDVLTVQKTGSALLIDGLDIALQATIGLVVLGFYHPFLLVFDAFLIASIAFILFGLGRGALHSARKESEAKYRVAAALEEIAHAPVTHKLAGAADFAENRLANLTDAYLQVRRRHYGIVFRQLTGAVALHALAGTALLTLGGFLVIQGQLTLGQLVAAELIVSVALVSFVKFGKQLESFYDLLAGVDKLGVLFDLPLDEDRGEVHEGDGGPASMELRNTSYAHAGHIMVLRDLSFRIAPGERVAMLGSRGSGKSTITQILSGLRQPGSGIALFDGVDIREIAARSIRRQLQVIHAVELVDGTIFDNVRLGREEVTSDEIRRALRRFGILDELMTLPDGLNTRLSVRGDPLSHTTALLMMFARATVGEPRAILVDSVLDELSGQPLQQAVDGLQSVETATLLVLTARDDIAIAMDRVESLPDPKMSKNDEDLHLAGGAA